MHREPGAWARSTSPLDSPRWPDASPAPRLLVHADRLRVTAIAASPCARHQSRRSRTVPLALPRSAVGSTSCTSGCEVRARSACRLPVSNDWMNTGAGPRSGVSDASSAVLERQTRSRGNAKGAWFPDRRRSGQARRAPLTFTRARSCRISANAAICNCAIVLRTARPQLRNALARTQRLQLREREVLGEPAVDRHRHRSAARAGGRRTPGASATSVVPPISFSCRATSTPSRVVTRSGSM